MTECHYPVHPYIPNMAPTNRQQMLQELGISSPEDLFADVPPHLRVKGLLDLPQPLLSEYDLYRHTKRILVQNKTCADYLSFLGGGCWQHYVPAVCDEINSRGEFLTAYTGDTYQDHGRWQALFEFASLMGELLNMEIVSVPTYDWGQAAATSIRMAQRITGRGEVLVASVTAPERLCIMAGYCGPSATIRTVPHDPATGLLLPDEFEKAISESTAAVYFENPSYLGVIQGRAPEIAEMAHGRGALCIVGADPISLGVLAPPADYGADIVCGDLQPLGIHMNYGGGLSGFIASHDEPRFVMEFPTRLVGITQTTVEGEHGFGEVAFYRTSFIEREQGKEYVGTGTSLWAITAGVYLALLGPQGMKQIGEAILQRTQYAKGRLGQVPGVRVPASAAPSFKEFVVDFNGTGKTVAQVNKALLGHGIFGGKDLTQEFPALGQSALFCVTEIHTKQDIDRLAACLEEVVAS